MKILFLLYLFIFLKMPIIIPSDDLTPFKYVDTPDPSYVIPSSIRSTTERTGDASDIVYYLSKPNKASYPIAILCGGSTSKEDINSIIHLHRYFLAEFLELGVAVLTVEQWGIDGSAVDAKEFWSHYTRTQRLNDHRTVIEHLKAIPPKGWNGKFIFCGISEGGSIVTTLTMLYPEYTLATINWSGAGDWNWGEELWIFLQNLLKENPECPQHHFKLQDCSCNTIICSREVYDAQLAEILANPTSSQEFFGMSYKYHADALTYIPIDYPRLRTPFLVVSGTLDSLIQSSDAFVEKAKAAGAPITYHRINDMDHYVRKKPDVVEQSFRWLEEAVERS